MHSQDAGLEARTDCTALTLREASEGLVPLSQVALTALVRICCQNRWSSQESLRTRVLLLQ